MADASSSVAVRHETNPLEDEDLLLLVLERCKVTFDYDTLVPCPDRAALRLLHSTSRRLIDGFAKSYRDVRRLATPAEVADRAVSALHAFPSLRRLQLEGLDDAALMTVVAGLRHASCPIEALGLQKGIFTGTGLYTCHEAMSIDDMIVGDNDHIQAHGDAGIPDLSDAAIGAASPAVPPSPASSDGGSAAAVLPSLPSLVPPSRLLHRLAELDLGGCGNLTDAGLEALVGAAPLLSRLNLTVNALLRTPRLTCPWLRSATIAICANLRDEAVSRLCVGAPLLGELSLWRCSSLSSPAIRAPHLEILNLCECVELREAAVHALHQACPRLRSLLLAGCAGLGDGGAVWGGHTRPTNLTHLDLSDNASATEASLNSMCALSPRLRRLDVSRSGHALRAPVMGGVDLTNLICTRCEGLEDEAVSAACDRSPRLASLMLALCTSLHSPRVHGAQLTELNFSGCHQLQDAAASHACRHAPSLARLTLSLCASLVAPFLRAPSLRRLDCSHCEKLATPDVGGEALEEACLSGCAMLEDTALEAACARSPSLARLTISGCTRLSAAKIEGRHLRLLAARGVDRRVVDAATDGLRCPTLRKVTRDLIEIGESATSDEE